MARIIVTAEVEDLEKWEAGFRTHGDLFKRQTVSTPIGIGSKPGNQVALYMEPENLDAFMELFEAPDTAEAMAFDGVKRDTVRLYVLDRDFTP